MKRIIAAMLCAGMIFPSATCVSAAQKIDLDGYSFEVPDGWQSFGQIYYNGTDSFPRLYVIDSDAPASFDELLAMGDSFASEYIVDVDSPETIIPLHETSYADNKALTTSVFAQVQGNSGGPAVVQTDVFENPAGGFVFFAYYYNDTNREYFDILDSVSFVGGESVTEEPAADTAEPSMGQKNALGTAKTYLDYMPFSYSGLIGQLEYDGYTTEEATYAADNCEANWNEMAAKSADSYLNYMSFSRQGLIDQLLYDGFTQEQAEYAAAAVGY